MDAIAINKEARNDQRKKNSQAACQILSAVWCFSAVVLLGLPAVWAQYPLQYPSSSQVTKDGTAILIEDYANPPLSSQMGDHAYPPPIDYKGMLARVNTLRSEPANAPLASTRFFVADMNGNLYTLDKATRKFTPYITFPEIFPKYATDRFGSGVSAIVFDPNYAKNGKFYTVHVEDPAKPVSAQPTNAKTPNLKLDGYAITPVVKPPAGEDRERIGPGGMDGHEHQEFHVRGDGAGNPARRIQQHDSSHGRHSFRSTRQTGKLGLRESLRFHGRWRLRRNSGATQTTPQLLSALQGKILRITPDLALRPNDKLSENGRYRIPSTGSDPNPFVSVPQARGEIFAYGFRNPHRMDWDTVTNTLLANDIGLHSWEEVDIVTKGGNYGYSQREGDEVLVVPGGGKTGTQLNPAVHFPGFGSAHRGRARETGRAHLSRGLVQPRRGRLDRQRLCLSRQEDAADGWKIHFHGHDHRAACFTPTSRK